MGVDVVNLGLKQLLVAFLMIFLVLSICKQEESSQKSPRYPSTYTEVGVIVIKLVWKKYLLSRIEDHIHRLKKYYSLYVT